MNTTPTVLITGGSVGTSKATAQKFAAEGHNVVIAGRNNEQGNATAAEIAASTGTNYVFNKVDVQNEQEAIDSIHQTVAQFEQLDCIVNNAGISGEQAGFWLIQLLKTLYNYLPLTYRVCFMA